MEKKEIKNTRERLKKQCNYLQCIFVVLITTFQFWILGTSVHTCNMYMYTAIKDR